MKKLRLNTGYEMPILGLGTWKSDKGQVYKAIRDAIKIGYRHFDCAAAYGNESEIGEALSDAIKMGDTKREELFITSKLWNDSHSKKEVAPAFEKTLKDLKLDYLDLYLMHWPVALKPGKEITEESFISLKTIPLSETWAAMEDLKKCDLVRSIGVSNFSIKKLKEMKDYATIAPSVNQIESHPFLQQNQMLKFCQETGIVMTAYAPLASRDRPKNLKADNEPALMEHPVIEQIADKHNATPAQILIAWQINRHVSVIPKSTSSERLLQNFEASKIVLDGEDMMQIANLDKGFRYISGEAFVCKAKGYTLETIWDE